MAWNRQRALSKAVTPDIGPTFHTAKIEVRALSLGKFEHQTGYKPDRREQNKNTGYELPFKVEVKAQRTR